MLNPELSLECRNRLAPAVNAKPAAGDAYSRGFFEVGMVPAYTAGPGRVGEAAGPGGTGSPPVPAPLTWFPVSPRFPRHSPGSWVFPWFLGLPPALPSPCLRIFNVRGLTALGGTAGRPPAPEIHSSKRSWRSIIPRQKFLSSRPAHLRG